ncbi:MAG: nucleotide-binding protein [Desulfobacula sp.]|nr:nucleotide-binding protein [Desulfobacula sp.]
MNEIFKQDIKALIKLQEAETQIVRLKVVLEEIKKQKDKLSSKLKKFGNALEKQKDDLIAASKACMDSEREVQIVDERIIKSNETLRMVKTNKEYQVLLREVDDNKKRKDNFETELLEYLDEKEKIEESVQESQKEFDLLKDQIEAEQRDIEKKSMDDRELLEEYLAQQNEIGKNLDPSLMERFTKISKMNQGLAVINVDNAICRGCFMNIPPQLYIEVKRENSLILCPQCSRILYYKEKEEV